MSLPSNPNSSSVSGQSPGDSLCDDRTGAIPTDYSIGEIIFGKFEVLERLGAGGVGTVYKVRQTLMDHFMALKVLSSRAVDPNTLIRFQNEARTLSRLEHSAIAKIYDFGVEDGKPFMAIEYLNGVTLEERLKKQGTLTVPEFLAVFLDVCAGLLFSHEKGILHRDVKPGNIMLIPSAVNDSVSAKVLDFGLAKDFDDSLAQQLTVDGSIIGTPLYMSPEQANGQPATFKSDMYSLGCVMFESLSGEPPFLRQTALETLVCHQSEPFPSLKDAVGESSEIDELSLLIEKLTMKAPEERFASLANVIEILEKMRTPEEVNSEDDQIGASTAGDTKSESKFSETTDASRRRQRNAFVAVGICMCIAAVMFAFQLFNRQEMIVSRTEVTPIETKMLSVEHMKLPDRKDSVRRLMDQGGTKFNLEEPSWTDDDLKVFDNYDKAQVITLRGCDISDRGLTNFVRAKDLKVLDLSNTKVSRLQPLNTLTKLETLRVADTKVDDSSVDFLCSLPSLKNLDIEGTLISMKGFAKLVRSKTLNSLSYDVPSNKKSMDEYLELLRQNPSSKLLIVKQVEPIRKLAKQFESERKFAEAHKYFKFIYEVRKLKGEEDLSKTINSCLFAAGGIPDQKLVGFWREKAVEEAERKHGTRRELTSAYMVMIIHQIINAPEKAPKSMDKYLSMIEKKGTKPLEVVDVADAFGDAWLRSENFTQALKYYDLALAKARSVPTGSDQAIRLAICRGDRAVCLSRLEKFQQARPELIAAINVLKNKTNLSDVEAAKVGIYYHWLAFRLHKNEPYDGALRANTEGIAFLDNYDNGALMHRQETAKQYMVNLLRQRIVLFKRLNRQSESGPIDIRLKKLLNEIYAKNQIR